MRFPLLVSIITLCCARVLAAEATPKPAPPAEARPPIFAPQPAVKKVPAGRPRLPPPAARRGSAISPEMSKKLSDMVERVAPPSAKGIASPVTPAPPTDGSPDVVMLDPFVVNEDKEPNLKERQLLTPKEKLALALRNNPGLKLGPVPLGNNAVALDLLEDEFERQRRGELVELGGVLNAAGRKAPPEVQRKIDEASTRKNDWLNQKPGTPFREPR
jgi:hypothetical protein